MIQLLLQHQTQECIVEETTGVSVPRIQEAIVDVIQCISQERISERVIEQTVDVSVPQTRDPIVEVATVIPQECLQQRTVEQIVDVPVPRILEETVEVVQELFKASHRRVSLSESFSRSTTCLLWCNTRCLRFRRWFRRQRSTET